MNFKIKAAESTSRPRAIVFGKVYFPNQLLDSDIDIWISEGKYMDLNYIEEKFSYYKKDGRIKLPTRHYYLYYLLHTQKRITPNYIYKEICNNLRMKFIYDSRKDSSEELFSVEESEIDLDINIILEIFKSNWDKRVLRRPKEKIENLWALENLINVETIKNKET